MTLLFLCQINVVPEIQGTVNVEASSRKTKKNARNAYKKMLLKNVKWSNGYYARSKELYFTCIDINKDGVKELILYYMDSPHAYGWNRIYTYTDGRVKSLGQFTSVSICTNKKYFTDSYMNGGIGRKYFYQLGKNGKKIKESIKNKIGHIKAWKDWSKKCKITMENINDKDAMTLYYQIDYTLTEVPEDAAYFHAQYRQAFPNETSDYTVIDNIKGKGHFVGVYMAWGVNNNGWWGEGEIKFFIDGDNKFPTICGTGTEDYFCGSYNFDRNGQYTVFNTPYAGLHQVIRPDGAYRSQQRFGLYRWHVLDPIRFEKDLRITIQDLGWRHGGRYLPQKSDISSVTYWYQSEPHSKFPKLPGWEELEIN